MGVGAGTGEDHIHSHDPSHDRQAHEGVQYDEHAHAVGDGYDFFAEVGAADEAALSALAAGGVLGEEQGVEAHGLGHEHELVQGHEHGQDVIMDDGEQDLENAVLRQQAEDIVSSILPRHLQ